MQRVTVKTTLILIASQKMRKDYKVYRSLRDVPPALRKKLIESTNGPNSDTLLIVDQRGKEEIERVVQSLPAESRKRYEPVLANSPAPQPGFSLRKYRPWPEVALAGAVGLIIWALAFWR